MLKIKSILVVKTRLKTIYSVGFIYTKQWEKALKMVNEMERAYTHATKQVSDDMYAVCKDIPSIVDINAILIHLGKKVKTGQMKLSDLVDECTGCLI